MKNLLYLGVVCLVCTLHACQNPPAEKTDIVGQLDAKIKKIIKDQNVQGQFGREAMSTDSLTTVVYKNKAVGNAVRIQARDTSILLGLFVERTKNDTSTSMRKVVLTRRETKLAVEIIDLKTNKVLERLANENPIPPPPPPPPPGEFDSIEECFNDFMCNNSSKFQCQANETCKPVVTGVLCKLDGGIWVWIDFIIFTPNDPRCRFLINRIDIPNVFATL